MASSKPTPRKPMVSRTPSTGVKKPMPKILGPIKPARTPMPKPTKKGITVAISKGVTMDAKTGIKTTAKPTPKAIPTKSDAQYFADQKKFIASRKKK